MAGRAAGFWSYVRADDKAIGGRITTLAESISAAYEMLTGDPLDLFLDRDSIEWGDAWKQRIEEAIAGTTFFIPVVTPRYFASEQCRRELVRFMATARQLGLTELLLPIYYVRVPELDASQPEDELMSLVKNTQWEDWRELSLEDDDSSAVRKGVRNMASRLADIGARVASVPERVDAPSTGIDKSADEEDGPGFIDVLAQGEEAMPRMSAAAEAIAIAVEQVGTLMEASSEEVRAADARGAGFAARLKIARDLAGRLDAPAQVIEDQGREFGRAVLESDPAVNAILDAVEGAIGPDESAQSEEIEEALEFVETMRQLAQSTDYGMGELRTFATGLDDISTISRDIRRPATQMKKGLQGMVDAQALIQAWGDRARALDDRSSEQGEATSESEPNEQDTASEGGPPGRTDADGQNGRSGNGPSASPP
jgi:TIR domain